MRVLNDEEIAKAIDNIIGKEWRAGWEISECIEDEEREIAKAQHQLDIEEFIKELESHSFYDDFGGDSAKSYRDRLIEKLRVLVL